MNLKMKLVFFVIRLQEKEDSAILQSIEKNYYRWQNLVAGTGKVENIYIYITGKKVSAKLCIKYKLGK